MFDEVSARVPSISNMMSPSIEGDWTYTNNSLGKPFDIVIIHKPLTLYVFKKRTDENCSICGRTGAALRVDDGYVCRYCAPISHSFGKITVSEILSEQIKDEKLRQRVDLFQSTVSFGYLQFDEKNGLVMKGPYPNYQLPIISFNEIDGYSILADDEPIVFNSITGKRSVFVDTSDEYLNKLIKKYSEFNLEMNFTRHDVIFRKYSLMSSKSRISDTKLDSMKEIVKLSVILDGIVENNYASEGGL